MASRKTLIGIALLSAAIAAAVVVMFATKDATEPTAAKKRVAPPATKTTSTTGSTARQDPLTVGHKWTTTVQTDTNLVVGDPAGAAEGTSTVYKFEVVKPGTDGAPKAGSFERIVRATIVGGEGPFADPIFLRYTRAKGATAYTLTSAKISGQPRELPAAQLKATPSLTIPLQQKISEAPKATKTKLKASPSTTPPPALPPAGAPPGGAPPSGKVPPLPTGGGSTPAAPVQ